MLMCRFLLERQHPRGANTQWGMACLGTGTPRWWHPLSNGPTSAFPYADLKASEALHAVHVDAQDTVTRMLGLPPPSLPCKSHSLMSIGLFCYHWKVIGVSRESPCVNQCWRNVERDWL